MPLVHDLLFYIKVICNMEAGNAFPLRIGIMGAAHVARKMTRAFEAASDVQLVAVASRSLETAKKFVLSLDLSVPLVRANVTFC